MNILVGTEVKRVRKVQAIVLKHDKTRTSKETSFVVSCVRMCLLFAMKLRFYFSDMLVDLLETLIVKKTELPVQQVKILK